MNMDIIGSLQRLRPKGSSHEANPQCDRRKSNIDGIHNEIRKRDS
jgi:hypothetical protein